jgi:hypothetical protein
MIRVKRPRKPQTIVIADLPVAATPSCRPLLNHELFAASGGLPSTGYVCSAPSNDCSKE